MVNVRALKNALVMAVEDEVTDEDDITKTEVVNVGKRFAQILNQLKDEANDDEDEDTEDLDEDDDADDLDDQD